MKRNEMKKLYDPYFIKPNEKYFSKQERERYNIKMIDDNFDRLSKYVMESKDFERKILIAVIGMYLFIICHIIGFVIGKVVF